MPATSDYTRIETPNERRQRAVEYRRAEGDSRLAAAHAKTEEARDRCLRQATEWRLMADYLDPDTACGTPPPDIV